MPVDLLCCVRNSRDSENDVVKTINNRKYRLKHVISISSVPFFTSILSKAKFHKYLMGIPFDHKADTISASLKGHVFEEDCKTSVEDEHDKSEDFSVKANAEIPLYGLNTQRVRRESMLAKASAVFFQVPFYSEGYVAENSMYPYCRKYEDVKEFYND